MHKCMSTMKSYTEITQFIHQKADMQSIISFNIIIIQMNTLNKRVQALKYNSETAIG